MGWGPVVYDLVKYRSKQSRNENHFQIKSWVSILIYNTSRETSQLLKKVVIVVAYYPLYSMSSVMWHFLGTDVNAVDASGRTPLHLARSRLRLLQEERDFSNDQLKTNINQVGRPHILYFTNT